MTQSGLTSIAATKRENQPKFVNVGSQQRGQSSFQPLKKGKRTLHLASAALEFPTPSLKRKRQGAFTANKSNSVRFYCGQEYQIAQ